MSEPKRDIREMQRTLTRDRIMRALAEEICERGAHELSVQGVADRAGVSHRTIYRYFPSKDELFTAYGEWLDEVLGSDENMPERISELGERAAETFRRFEAHPMLIEAYVRIHSTGQSLDVRRRRSESFVELVAAGTDLDPTYQRSVAAILRRVVNSETWARSREEFDVGGEPLQEVTAWLTNLAVDAMERGDVPSHWKRGEEE